MWILEKTKLRLQKRGKTMSRVIHFEIPASDPERASAFYQKVFGWKIEKWPGPMEYWLVTTSRGNAGDQRRSYEEYQCKDNYQHDRCGVRRRGHGGGEARWWKTGNAEDSDSRRRIFWVLRRHGRKSLRCDAGRQECQVSAWGIEAAGVMPWALPRLPVTSI